MPVYSQLEEERIERLDAHNRDLSLQERIQVDDLALRQEHFQEIRSVPFPPPDQWILDPRWQASLGKLEFWVLIHHGKWASAEDQKVRLAVSNGRIEVRIRLGATSTRDKEATVPVTDICDAPPGGLRTTKVKARAYDARGLFLVAFPDEKDMQHMGKLVRRICPGGGIGIYYVQRVSVDPIAARVGFKESLPDEPPFEIHYSALLLVHMSATLNESGNRLMYDVRTRYGGHTNASDKPKDSKSSHKRKAEVMKSIETADSLGGHTPAWPSTKPPIDNREDGVGW